MENSKREKPRDPTHSKLSLCQESIQQGSIEATTSRSLPSSDGGYNKESLCISLTLSHSLSILLCTIVTLITLYNKNNNTTQKVFALGHIYANMSFEVFTNVAPMGALEHIYIYVPSSGEGFSSGLHYPVLTGSSSPGTHIPSGGTEFLTPTSRRSPLLCEKFMSFT